LTPHAQDTALWIDWIKKVCDPRVYLDIGAGDGFDCGVVKEAFPDCRCIAIEPVEDWVVGDEVEKNRDVIGAADEYRCYHIKNQSGIHSLYSRLTVPTTNVKALPVRTLSHFCEREGIRAIDAMKIDAEGAAWDVLVGAGDLLLGVKAIHIETEWVELFEKQRLEAEVFSILQSYGFTKTWENRVEDLGQGDSIWARQ
jgi:FkbM family methyltransferase